MGLQSPEVSILLLDDVQIAGLNAQYLKRQGPTDVISFPMFDNSFPAVQPQVLGDVVISVETARRQAQRARITLDEEIRRLLIHGILHLLGYDHEVSRGEGRKMHAMEKEILHKTGQNKNVFTQKN